MGSSWIQGQVDSQGESIYYEGANLDARAPTVVLGHGAGGNHAVWFQQVPALAERYRVITWDTRGFGNSTFTTGAFGVSESTADLLAVLDATDTADAHLVGQSMGGWWITGVAVTAPERVRSLSWCDTVGGLWKPALREAFREFTQGPGLAVDDPQVGVHPALAEDFPTRRPDLAFLYQQLSTYADPPMREVVAALGGAGIEPADLAASDSPMMVLAGDQDRIFPASLLCSLAEELGAHWIEIPHAGHSPYFERADQFNAALLDFLARA